MGSTDKLIQSYNNAIKDPGNVQSESEYQSTKAGLLGVIARLETQVVFQESKLVLIGLANTVNKVISECDAGIAEVKENNFLHISEHFMQANINNDFVRSNVRTLIQKELEYLSVNQARSNQLYTVGLVISVSIFILILLIVLVFARNFSRDLISPIENLTRTVEQVASGNMEVDIDRKLGDQKDEVGVLARSFVQMVNNIQDMIAKINKSREDLETSNVDLEKLNQFMVDREIKMVELKNKLSELMKKGEL
jgi:nitrogen fixation/metabolism regulation signal transduction histidine kinase